MKRSKRLRIARRIETSYPVKKVRRNHFVRQIHRPRYNWMICIGCSLLIFVTMGLVSSGFSVYFPFLARTYGLSNTQVSLLTTVRCAASFFSMLIVGPFYKWTGLRRGVTIASCSAFAHCSNRATCPPTEPYISVIGGGRTRASWKAASAFSM